MLGVTDFGVGVDYLLSSFEKLLSELSELEDFSFNEWVSESAHRTVDELLVWLPILEYALPEWGEWRLGAIAWLGPQCDSENGVSLPHGEEGSRTCVVQHESHIFGPAVVVVGVAYGCRDAEPSV